MALQFPLAKKMGIGVGLEPISYVGYDYGSLGNLNAEGEYSLNRSKGTGGLSQVYGALSYELFDNFSLGAKFAYLFGNVNHDLSEELTVSSYSTIWRDTIHARGLTYELGLQYRINTGKYQSLVLGAVYSPKTRFNGKVTSGFFRGSSVPEEYHVSTDSVFELPETYGIGVTYNKLNKLTVGVDVQYQKWSKAKFYDQTDYFYDRWKISAGGEFIPNQMNNHYLNRVRYRAGAFYTKSYLNVKGSRYGEYGVSAGFGLPMTDRRSFLNLSAEYSLIQPEISTFTKERSIKFTVSYTFNEWWFFKRKLQ
jgi:hypothetical protein